MGVACAGGAGGRGTTSKDALAASSCGRGSATAASTATDTVRVVRCGTSSTDTGIASVACSPGISVARSHTSSRPVTSHVQAPGSAGTRGAVPSGKDAFSRTRREVDGPAFSTRATTVVTSPPSTSSREAVSVTVLSADGAGGATRNTSTVTVADADAP